MEGIVITWREMLLGALLVLGVYVAEVLLLTRSGKQVRFRGEGNGSHSMAAELRAEVETLHRRLDNLQTEVDLLKQGQSNSVRPYGEAVKLADEGMDVGELASSCGISRGEAELIIAVNRLSRQKNTL